MSSVSSPVMSSCVRRPSLVFQIYGGLFTPDEGHIDPYSLTQAIAKGARAHGAQLVVAGSGPSSTAEEEDPTLPKKGRPTKKWPDIPGTLMLGDRKNEEEIILGEKKQEPSILVLEDVGESSEKSGNVGMEKKSDDNNETEFGGGEEPEFVMAGGSDMTGQQIVLGGGEDGQQIVVRSENGQRQIVMAATDEMDDDDDNDHRIVIGTAGDGGETPIVMAGGDLAHQQIVTMRGTDGVEHQIVVVPGEDQLDQEVQPFHLYLVFLAYLVDLSDGISG